MTSDQFIMYLVVSLAILAVSYFIVRFFWDVNSQSKMMKAQTKLLAKIASKNGVTQDEIEGITAGID